MRTHAIGDLTAPPKLRFQGKLQLPTQVVVMDPDDPPQHPRDAEAFAKRYLVPALRTVEPRLRELAQTLFPDNVTLQPYILATLSGMGELLFGFGVKCLEPGKDEKFQETYAKERPNTDEIRDEADLPEFVYGGFEKLIKQCHGQHTTGRTPNHPAEFGDI